MHTSNRTHARHARARSRRPAGAHEGIQIFQARSNTSNSKLNGGAKMSGMSDDEGTGTMYFPNAKYEIMGNNAQYFIGGIIAKNIEMHGTADIHVTRGYDTGVPGQEVYLAE